MADFQANDRLGQTERYYTERDAMASFPSRIGDQAPRKRGYSEPNQIDLENYPFKNSWSYPKFLESPTLSIDVNSNASSENYPRTTNTSMSGEQLENDEALKPDKISHMDRFRSHYHADDHPTASNFPTRPISNEASTVVATNQIRSVRLDGRDKPSEISQSPKPTKKQSKPDSISEHNTVSTGPLQPPPAGGLINEDDGAIGDFVGGAWSTKGDTPPSKLPSKKDFGIMSIPDKTTSDDDGNRSTLDDYAESTSDNDDNKSSDIGWLCTQDPKESGYMTLIPYSLSPVEPPEVFTKPSKADVRRLARLRQDVRRRRLEIQKLCSLREAKDKQNFDANEEAFRRLGEFVAERHGRSKTHDSSLQKAIGLFLSSRLGQDESGHLRDEISTLQERLASREIKLTLAEDSLYKKLGIPPIESNESQENHFAKPGLPIVSSEVTSESGHNTAQYAHNAKGEDSGSDDDACSIDSFDKYRKDYHPLYVEYQERRGAQENLFERHAYIMEDLIRLEDEQESRRRVGLTLSKENEDFLNSIPEAVRLLDAEIEQNGSRIEQLRKQCLEQGIIDEDNNYIDGDRDDSDVSDDSHNSVPPPPPPPLPPPLPPSTAAKPPAPTLPSQINITPNAPSSQPTTAHSIIVSNLGNRLDDQSYQNRINPWLLGKLTESRTELTLLATILSAMDANPDVASIRDVLKLWNHDGAGVEPPQRPGKLDEATLNRLRTATRVVVGDGFDRALVSSLFGLSLWGGQAYRDSEETAYLDDT